MSPQPPVRVLIADDHLVFAEALALTLAADRRVQVVGRAADGKSAVEQAGSLHPDVILMDLDMPVVDGIQATRSVRRFLPDCRVAVLTASLLPEDALRARAAGAAAYLTKGCSSRDLLEAVLELGYCNLAREPQTESEVVAQT
jgi:two-component system, NarL family, response regulator LiaR